MVVGKNSAAEKYIPEKTATGKTVGEDDQQVIGHTLRTINGFCQLYYLRQIDKYITFF